MAKINSTLVLRKHVWLRYTYLMLAVTCLVLLLISCRGDDKELTLVDESVRSIHVTRNYISGDLPIELNKEEQNSFIQSFNKMNLKTESDYSFDRNLIPDGGGYDLIIIRDDAEDLEVIDIGTDRILLPQDAKSEQSDDQVIYDSCYVIQDQDAYEDLVGFLASLYEG